ncbi:hypothetical protein H3S74_12305 [Gilliamella sp. W8126]|uniref:hypothetical protein n=1 Tax=Gilliamella sp. W8126 TaxID=2750946 RepID=UPI0018DD4904|nr:hypothetical protein [Gilliamella sp. W8126]MBI0007012.1 hypothetical protein [Gilliamella sp. W8126]
MHIVFDNKINGWDIFVLICVTCFIVQTMGELFRGEKSLSSGILVFSIYAIVVACPFISINTDDEIISQDNQKYVLKDCSPQSKSKTETSFFITCTNSDIRNVDNDTYLYYRDVVDVEPTDEMIIRDNEKYISKLMMLVFTIICPFFVYFFANAFFRQLRDSF